MQAPDPAVPGIGASLDHAALLQPVDQPGDGDRLDFQQFGQFLLGQAGLAVEPEQDDPLRAGQAVAAGAPVGIEPEVAGEVVEQEQDVGAVAHGAYDKQRYVKLHHPPACTGRWPVLRYRGDETSEQF